MSLPGRYNFTVQRGAPVSKSFRRKVQETGVAIDLTGYKARAQFRKLTGAQGISAATTLLLALTDTNGIEVTTPLDGLVTLDLTAADVETICPGNIRVRVAYGIELYDDNYSPERVMPFLQGYVTVLPETVR